MEDIAPKDGTDTQNLGSQLMAYPGRISDQARCGRRRMATVWDDWMLIRMSLCDRHRTSSILMVAWQDHGVNASKTTVKKRLREGGLHGRITQLVVPTVIQGWQCDC